MSSDDRATVLIVDDEPDVVSAYRHWLDDEYEVLVAHGGEEGLEEFHSGVDVILLDRMMPDLSGDEMLERVRAADHDCQVVMVTAVDPDLDIVEMGFDAYLTKPIGRDQLFETVENLLDRATYDDLLQQYYALVEKQATLEATTPRSDLEDRQEYQQLQAEIERVREELSDTLDGFVDDETFVATLRKIDSDL
ncbi:MAG: response regulator transcription factor [Salinirussus sp.]